MSMHIKRINAIIALKFQTVISNASLMINPVIALFIVLILRNAMGNIPQAETGFNLDAFLLGFGLVINIISGGLFISSTSLAEEKEKNTLRVLMTSSVKNQEYLLGSLIPPFVIILITNLLIVPASGVDLSKINLPAFLFITISAAFISILLGFVFGILAKDQAQAGVIVTPALLVLTMLPQFRLFNETINTISTYTYSGVITKYVNAITGTSGYTFNLTDNLVLLAWGVGSLLIFLVAYKKKGIDHA